MKKDGDIDTHEETTFEVKRFSYGRQVWKVRAVTWWKWKDGHGYRVREEVVRIPVSPSGLTRREAKRYIEHDEDHVRRVVGPEVTL